MDARHELICLETHGDLYLAQFAVDGHLTESFWVHKSIREAFPREEDFMAKLTAYADTMYEQYGDIRESKVRAA